MNTSRCPFVLRLLFFLPLIFLPGVPLLAQETGGKSSLTFDHYPYSFSDENPLKPESAVLLQFNVPVSPEAVAGGIRLYDQPNERFAAVSATRPTPAQIDASAVPMAVMRSSRGVWIISATSSLSKWPK